MTESPVLFDIVTSKVHPHAKIGVFSLNRPRARNALSRSVIDTLGRHLTAIENDESIRGVIVRSTSSGVFCAGADLVERRDMSDGQVLQFLTDMRTAFTRLSNLSVPTVSVITGHALGGGLELGLCTDLRVLGGTAKVGLPESTLGIIPGAGGTQRLTRLIGPSNTKRLIFSGRVITASEALQFGIASDVSEAPYEAALTWLDSVLGNSPLSIALAKRAIAFHGDLERGLDYERTLYEVCLASPDRQEGLRAFKEKRPPIYGNATHTSPIKSKL